MLHLSIRFFIKLINGYLEVLFLAIDLDLRILVRRRGQRAKVFEQVFEVILVFWVQLAEVGEITADV